MRIIVDNITEQQALQVNGPIGEDIWRDVNHLEIGHNKASGNSTQFNYPITKDVFERVMARRSQSLVQLGIGLVLALVLGLVASWAFRQPNVS